MRMFVALRPPTEVAEHLAEFLEPRRDAAAFRWTGNEHLHLTLAFLAEVPDHAVDALEENLAVATSRRRSLDTRVAGGGAFPDVARGRVLWAGLELADGDRTELDRLATGCRNAAVSAGLEVDCQRFRPHLTLARCGRPTELTRWVRLLNSYVGPVWPAAEVVLFASHLGEGPRRRPRYEEMAAFSLT